MAETDYYWVPGTWVEAPQPGYLWTPGYWGWDNDVYIWHAGYWGEHVGFYGGVNYGFGYGGIGFEGGYWQHGTFFYNRSVNRIPASVHITNVYNRTVVNNVTVNRVSFNGGNGGIQARPTPHRSSPCAQRERHLQPISAQLQHEQAARNNPALRASFNHGTPAIAATAHPGMFSGHGVVAAHGAMAGAPAGAGAHGPGQSARVPAPGGGPAVNDAVAHQGRRARRRQAGGQRPRQRRPSRRPGPGTRQWPPRAARDTEGQGRPRGHEGRSEAGEGPRVKRRDGKAWPRYWSGLNSRSIDSLALPAGSAS